MTVALAIPIAAPALALVHASHGSGLLEGWLHPLTGIDHVLAMVAVGLWGARLGARASWALPITFAFVMTLGGWLGMSGVPLPAVELAVASSVIALGAMVALEVRPPLAVAAALVAAFAIFHGHAHGTELPPDQSAVAYSGGFVLATAGLNAVGIAIGFADRRELGCQLLSATGALMAATGALLLCEVQ